MELKTNQSLYELLEVAPEAPQEEIHKAFLRAKSTYSPNSPALYSIFTREEADQLLKLIDEAYAVLGNPAKRKEYDQSLRGRTATADDVTPTETKPESKPTAKPKPSFEIIDEPKGPMGKTAFSHYQIDARFEEEISRQEIFDGSFLQKVREYKNITLDQLSTATRIGRHYLVAIESNDFHSLPANVFVRGFIQNISRILGIDPKKATDSFMKIVVETRNS